MILCGGAGERLWPASSPSRPKPFLALVSETSGFQAAVGRLAPLAVGGGELIVVAGAAHHDMVTRQLDGASATVLLEPEGRNTAAAIAVAAAWVDRLAPDAVLVVSPADHHVPDAAAFRAAATAAAAAAAERGVIVTLGVRPTGPTTAYGYIRPGTGDGEIRPIAAFVEKPSATDAAALIAEGALWNSGVFIATARTLTEELARHAADVAAAASGAVAAANSGPVVTLGAAFAEAPRIAFDRAVMERTTCGAVLAVDFAWSDLGTWDAVRALAPDALQDGRIEVRDGLRVFARAAPGIRLEVSGLSDIAVIAEPEGVLVTALPGPAAGFADLRAAAAWLDRWLRTAALPLWATVGVDPATGAFREALTWNGEPHDPRRRTRVQARQVFVFASAAADGIAGPWRRTAQEGFAWFERAARRPDGLFASSLALGGGEDEPSARLYEHAFVLLALAGLRRAGASPEAALAEAEALVERLSAFDHPAGGFREAGDQPFQANAHMHLFEAAIVWLEAGGLAGAGALAERIADLALTRFIDPASGVLHEFFDAGWRPLPGDAGLIEPGHQFEWAWLLHRYGQRTGRADVQAAARRLFAAGRRAFDPVRGVVVNSVRADLAVRDAGARLWPQTEHLKAALALGETSAALQAANSLARYLDTPARGVWRERMRPDGAFVEEPSPATSLYHLYLAIRELARSV